MFFSLIQLRPEVFSQSQSASRWARKLSPWGLHQLVWDLFSDSPERKRDFLYRYEDEKNTPQFYVLSQRPPLDKTGDWLVKTKLFSPQLKVGQQLRFSLRANPTKKHSPLGKKSKRHDVMMDLKFQARPANQISSNEPDRSEMPSLAKLHEAAVHWLCERGPQHGFVADPKRVFIQTSQPVSISREVRLSSKDRSPVIKITTVDYEGVLTVQDPNLFGKMLVQGLGPAKGFGCGLFLLKRG